VGERSSIGHLYRSPCKPPFLSVWRREWAAAVLPQAAFLAADCGAACCDRTIANQTSVVVTSTELKVERVLAPLHRFPAASGIGGSMHRRHTGASVALALLLAVACGVQLVAARVTSAVIRKDDRCGAGRPGR
jgi:hypothetical protein